MKIPTRNRTRQLLPSQNKPPDHFLSFEPSCPANIPRKTADWVLGFLYSERRFTHVQSMNDLQTY